VPAGVVVGESRDLGAAISQSIENCALPFLRHSLS
jgi:hypothetical protein